MLAAYPVVPGYVAYVFGGIFTIIAIVYYLAGIRIYKNLQINFLLSYGLVFSQFFFGTLFYVIPSNAECSDGIVFCCVYRWYVADCSRIFTTCAESLPVGFYFELVSFWYFCIDFPFPDYFNYRFTPRRCACSNQCKSAVLFYDESITQALLMFSFLLLISIKISEKLEMKIEAQRKFFSIIAHDLSGPVGTATQMLELANNDDDIDVDRKNIIYHEVEKLSGSTYQLLQKLLFWSRNQLDSLNPDIQKFDLNKIILENIELLRHISANKDIAIVYEPKPELFCRGDAQMIDTVVRNLVSNSVKFTRSGGQVIIACEKIG